MTECNIVGPACQAHGSHVATKAVQNEEVGRPYLLCDASETRLKDGVLSFDEWFQLAKCHGCRKDLLREYPYSDMTYMLDKHVDLGIHFSIDDPVPLLLDYLSVWGLESVLRASPAIVQGQPSCDVASVLRDLDDRLERPASSAERGAVFSLFSKLVGKRGGDWILSKWHGTADKSGTDLARALVSALDGSRAATLLMRAVRDSAPELRHAFCDNVVVLVLHRSLEESMPWIDEYLSMLSQEKREHAAYVLLSRFEDHRVLQIVENYVREVGYHGKWSSLCAVSKPSWRDLMRWLGGGSDLLRVAIDTALICADIDRSKMGGALRPEAISIGPPGSPKEFICALRHCRELYPLPISPRVLQKFASLENDSRSY
jgi:hypothetical protein